MLDLSFSTWPGPFSSRVKGQRVRQEMKVSLLLLIVISHGFGVCCRIGHCAAPRLLHCRLRRAAQERQRSPPKWPHFRCDRRRGPPADVFAGAVLSQQQPLFMRAEHEACFLVVIGCWGSIQWLQHF